MACNCSSASDVGTKTYWNWRWLIVAAASVVLIWTGSQFGNLGKQLRPIGAEVQAAPTITGEITEDLLKSLAANGAIGVAIVTCKRPHYLSRTMASVLRAKRAASQFPLVISQDANDTATRELVERDFVKTGQAYHMQHEHETVDPTVAAVYGGAAVSYSRIAQHFGYVMRRMFDEFRFEAVIFIEEDLEVSPDFFSYFGAMSALLRADSDIYCVSAWNDNGSSGLVQDPKSAFRTDFFPGLGWMMAAPMGGGVPSWFA